MSILQPIADTQGVRQAKGLIADLIDGPWDFNREWLLRNRWVAVPVESSDHFDEDAIGRLSAALQVAGHNECLAVATEPLENIPFCFRVSTSAEGLRALNKAAWFFNFVLFPEDCSCALLCTKSEYYLIAGPKDLVISALGTDLETARLAFRASVEDWLIETMKAGLRAVAERYEDLEKVP